jgi:putative transposase
MEQLKAFKYRIYPTADQINRLSRFFGAKRWVYNHFLKSNTERYKNQEKHLSNFDCNKEITFLKKNADTSWLKDVDDWVLKHASEDLATAYKNFFASITGKRKGPKVELPTFKKKSNRQSYRTRGVKVDFENGTFTVPKIKNIPCKFHRHFLGTIKNATISKTPDGKYFVSFLVDANVALLPQTEREVGIDFGIKSLAVLSTGHEIQPLNTQLEKINRAIKRAQRILARKTKGSTNREKQRVLLAKLFARKTRIREHYYHEISSFLVKNFDAIYLESLNIKGMMKNRKLSRAIQECSWFSLISKISYKSNFYGKTFHQISRWFPSSKTCSCCGFKLDKLSLDVREWSCQSCGTHHDRDLNAAVNILYQGQMDLYEQKQPQETGGLELKIPYSLQKHTTKIERSAEEIAVVGMWSRKA